MKGDWNENDSIPPRFEFQFLATQSVENQILREINFGRRLWAQNHSKFIKTDFK